MSSRILIMIAALFMSANAYAVDSDFDRCELKKLGWHFYCDKDLVEEIEEQKEVAPAASSSSPKTPADYIAARDAVRHELEWKQARMVLEPTQENIIDYIKTQRDKALEPSTKLAMNWRQAVWKTPEVDYTLKNPVNTLGKQASLDSRRATKRQVIADISKRYGVFYLYMSTCVYCKKYTPVLKAFAEKHNLSIKAISVDGPISPQWPNSVYNPKFVETLGMKSKPVPATILFDARSKRIIPVGFGLMAMDELETRIYEMTKEADNG